MATSTIAAASVPTSAPASASRTMKPGIYRGGSAAIFGLYRLREDGVWLFCMPVAGSVWKRARDLENMDKLILLVDETRL